MSCWQLLEKSKRTNKCYISCMPNEILHSILIYLNPIQLRSLVVLSKNFRELIRYILSHEIWVNISLERLNIRLRYHFSIGNIYIIINGKIMRVVNYTISSYSGSIRSIITRDGCLINMLMNCVNYPSIDTPIFDMRVLVFGKGLHKSINGINASPNIYP